MKKKETKNDNYLDRVPVRAVNIKWSVSDDGMVTLESQNKGLFNKMAQLLLKKPKISYIHLDKTGSYVWTLIDGKTDITALGMRVEEKFGEESHPLYERLAKYFQILDSYHFITWNN